MKIDQRSSRMDNVVELPLRLRPDQLEKLDAAVARAPRLKSKPIQNHSEAQIHLARERAVEVIRKRREREELFETVIFADPAWDLLLTLFVYRVDGVPISVSNVCNNTGVPSSTAFRHLSMLVEQGLVTRHSSSTDAGVVYAEMENDTLNSIVSLLTPSSQR